MYKYFLVGCMSAILLLGAGCSKEKQTTTTDNTTETPTGEDTSTELAQKAYLFCTQAGHTIKIRFIESLNKNVSYCVLENQECESIAYMNGTCPGNTSPIADTSIMFEPVLSDQFPLRLCEPKSNPVCGTDGKTYTNACIAGFLEAKIAHDGTCQTNTDSLNTSSGIESDVIDISRPAKEASRTTRVSVRPPAVGTTDYNEENRPDNEWVEIPTSLLQSTGSNSTVRRCGQGNNVTFLVEEKSSQGGFTTLYTEQGQVLCYPENDIQEQCPSFVQNPNYKTSCPIVSK